MLYSLLKRRERGTSAVLETEIILYHIHNEQKVPL